MGVRGAMIAVVALSLIGGLSAAAALGSSSVTLSQYNGTTKPGGLIGVNYTVALVNGTYGGTVLSVLDSNALAANGITAQLNTGLVYPTYSGRMLVSLSLNTTPGTYYIMMVAKGADPSAEVNFTLTVPGKQAPTTQTTVASTTTSSATTTAPASTTAQPTTIPQQEGGGNTVMYAIIVLIVFLGGMIAYKMMISKGKKGGSQPESLAEPVAKP